MLWTNRKKLPRVSLIIACNGAYERRKREKSDNLTQKSALDSCWIGHSLGFIFVCDFWSEYSCMWLYVGWCAYEIIYVILYTCVCAGLYAPVFFSYTYTNLFINILSISKHMQYVHFLLYICAYYAYTLCVHMCVCAWIWHSLCLRAWLRVFLHLYVLLRMMVRVHISPCGCTHTSVRVRLW